jgi:predicted RNA-binding protein associated with RNAse of E/G family
VYFTGQVVIVRAGVITPATFEQAIRRVDNQEFYIAEQPYLLGIDGPWAAAQVNYAGGV